MATHEHMSGTHEPKPNTVVDPVCGMYVDPQKARGTAEHQGQTYYFCSPRCAERFEAGPEKYLASRPKVAPLVQLGGSTPKVQVAPPPASGKGTVTYVCPMDPEVRESKPGPCPACGMALEPEAIEYTCPMHPQIIRDQPGASVLTAPMKKFRWSRYGRAIACGCGPGPVFP